MKDAYIEKAKKIKLIGTDVDGVLTDGSIYLGADGELVKVFYAQDGLAMKRAEWVGIKIVFITGRESRIVARRALELNVNEVHMGIEDKLSCMQKIWDRTGISPQQTAFIGDDVNDLPLMQAVGLACTVHEGAPEVQRIADIIAKKPAGRGAVREIIESIIKAQKGWQGIISKHNPLKT